MRIALLWMAAIAAAGCAGLPPKSEPAKLAAEAPLENFEPLGAAWPQQAWWRDYGDADLDRVIELALANAPSLVTAHARFDTARQSVLLAGAASGANVRASGEASRQRLSDNGLFPPRLLGFHWYDQFDLGLQASYTFDWWGRQKAAVASAIDEAHAASADRSAAELLLASSVADTYFGWQSDQSRLALAREHLLITVREREIATARILADLQAADEVATADAAVAATQGQIAALEGSARLRIVALAALVGRPPADLPALKPRSLPQLKIGVPDDVKIDLIARRADLTASRWRVQAAQKSRESVRAEFFPDISVNALAGLQSIDIGRLLEYGSRVPNAAAAIHLPIFDSGRLKARYGASQAAVETAVAAYQETLVSAAREVATQVAARSQIDAQRGPRLLEIDAALRLQRSAAARVRQGVTDLRSELTAAESVLDQRDALLQLDAAAVSADIGLQRALGGGYTDRTGP